MSHQKIPPIEHFHTQKTPETDETLRIVFSTLIQAYNTASQGRVTDTKTLRLLARQFEAIADSAEASDIFPYDARRAASALYNCALDIDTRAWVRLSDQASYTIGDVDSVEPTSETFQITTEVNNVTENITEKIKPLGRSTQFVDNVQDSDRLDDLEFERQTQKRINEDYELAMIPEQKSKVSRATREVKVTPETQIDKYIASYTVWETLLGWAKEAETMEFNDVEVKDLDYDGLRNI